MKMIKGTLAAAIVVAGMATAGAANAQLTSVGTTGTSFQSSSFTANASSASPSPTAGYTVVQNFDNCSVGSCAGLTGSYQIYSGSQPGNGTPPFGNDVSPYLAVLAGQVATYTLGGGTKSVQFDWGTVASTDTLVIKTSDGNSTTFTVPGAANPPGTGLYQQNGLFVATATAGTYITSLVFSASQNSFEVDNIATVATPEPATWGMMILGFGLVGGLMRRRSTKAAVRFA